MKYQVKNKWLEIEINEEKLVSDFFDEYCINKKKRNEMIFSGNVLVNRKKCDEKTRMNSGDVLSLHIIEIGVIDVECSDVMANILYEDEFCLVVSKPVGIIIHSDDELEDTLDKQVALYFQINSVNSNVRHLHRLDKYTSGCVLYSKCEFFQPFFDAQLMEKQISRKYIAVCDGVMKGKKRVINSPIGKDRHHNQKRRISSTGQEAITHIEILKKDRINNCTTVLCTLETGRTHQIRVHLESIGFPILSDELYGRPSELIDHCALHAYEISWKHPLTQEIITIKDENLNGLEKFMF